MVTNIFSFTIEILHLFLFYCCYCFFFFSPDSIKKLQCELKGLNKKLLEKNATTEELREKSVMLQHECTVKTNSITEVTQQKKQLEQQYKVRLIRISKFSSKMYLLTNKGKD